MVFYCPPPVLRQSKEHDIQLSMIHGSWCMVSSSAPSDSIYLVFLMPPTVLCNLFETVQYLVFLSWSEDVHVICK